MDNRRQTPTITVVIEVDLNGEPIEGRLLKPAALATSFRGWLSLAALIESTRAQPTYPRGHNSRDCNRDPTDHLQR